MKTKILLTSGMLMFFMFIISNRGATQTQNAPTKETISVWSMPEIEQLTSTFVHEYQRLHPGLDFKMKPLVVSGFAETMQETPGVAFVSKETGIPFNDASMLTMVVGRDVIVPVMNAANPFHADIENHGISVEKFREAVTADRANWNILLENKATEPLKIYALNDNSAQSAVASFLNVRPEMVATFELKSADEIIRLVQKDKYAIGFCRLLNVTVPGQQEMIENLKLLPIDKNGNGKIDYHEQIYSNLNDFKRGLWIGKYPASLINNVYAVSFTDISDENVAGFLSWVVTDGQQFMEPNGYSELVYNERQSRLQKLHPQDIALVRSEPRSASSKIYFFIGLGILFVAIIAGVVYRNRKKKAKMPLGTFDHRYTKILNEQVLSFPKGLYFDKSHTWVFMEKEGVVRFGIDDFIPNVTGEYTRVILKTPGEKVKRKEPVVTLVQKGKQITIHAPVSGIIKEINESLVADPFNINHSPYGEGWVYMIEPSNWLREIAFFKMGEAYKEWISKEITRLKDFLACSFHIKNLAEGSVAIQEGGELITQPLRELTPEIWEDFQSHFIDTSDMY